MRKEKAPGSNSRLFMLKQMVHTKVIQMKTRENVCNSKYSEEFDDRIPENWRVTASKTALDTNVRVCCGAQHCSSRSALSGK